MVEDARGADYTEMNNITMKLRVHDAKSLASGAVVIRGSHSQGKDKGGEYKPSMWFGVFVGDKSAPYLPTLNQGDYIAVHGRLAMDEYEGKNNYTIFSDRLEKLAGQEDSKPASKSKAEDDYDPFDE